MMAIKVMQQFFAPGAGGMGAWQTIYGRFHNESTNAHSRSFPTLMIYCYVVATFEINPYESVQCTALKCATIDGAVTQVLNYCN